MSESSEPLMTGRGVEQAIQAALDVIQVESRINVILKSSDGQEAAEDVERNWHKRVLAIKYLQLKEELEAGQPSKGGDKYSAKPSKGSGKGCAKPSEGRRNDRAKLLKQLKQDWCDHYGGDATESDAETDMQQARNLCLDATEIDLMISGKQGEITPTMAMQNTCFTEHRHGQPSTRLTVEALRKLLQGRGLGEALAGDAEKAGEKLRKMWSLQNLVKRRRHGEQLLLFYNGVEVEAQPQGNFPPNMLLFHFSHEELLCFPAKAAKMLTAENQGLTAENQGLKMRLMRLQRSQQQQYFLVSALVMMGAVAVFMYLKSVAEFPA